MSLYPSLEDMKVDQLMRAQAAMPEQASSSSHNFDHLKSVGENAPSNLTGSVPNDENLRHVYPTLNEYMGIEFTEEVIAANMPEYLSVSYNLSAPLSTIGFNINSNSAMVAPLSGNSVGLNRAQVSHGIREIVLCKGEDGKVGLRVKDVDKGVFVSLVRKDSPAALVGLRFGDQILQINGSNVAGMSMDTVHDKFKKCPENGITLAVRDRPFERTVTLHKDSTNHIGFQFLDGEITTIVRDSSAARNGLLINHRLLEINGQNVVGLREKEITKIINDAGQIVTVTIMPSFIYKHIIKHMSSSLLTKLMDHSVYDF